MFWYIYIKHRDLRIWAAKILGYESKRYGLKNWLAQMKFIYKLKKRVRIKRLVW